MGVSGLMYRVRLKSSLRLFTSGPIQRRLQYWSYALIGVVVFSAVLIVSSLALGALAQVPGGENLVARVPAGVFTLAFVALVFSGLAAAVHTMYLSDDVEVLSAMPITERTIFAYKFWEVLLGNAAFFGALALPVLLACGAALGAPVSYYLLLPVVSVLVLMLPTGLCVLLVMPLMRLLPEGKAREIVTSLGVFIGVGFYAAYFWVLEPGRADSGADPLRALAGSPILGVPPGTWASNALTGGLMDGLLPLGASALGLYLVCLSLTGWAYATGRARAAESGGRARSSGWAERVFGLLPQDVRAVAAKDLVAIPRDLRRSMYLVFPAAMFCVVVAFNYPRLAEGSPGLAYLPSVGLGALVAFQGGCMSVGIEGRPYWALVASPVSPMRLLWGKWATNALVGGLFGLLGPILAVVLVGFDSLGLVGGMAAGILGSAIAALYGVGFSAMFPRFDWENPNQAMTMGGGLLAGICVLLLMVSVAIAALAVFALGGFLPLTLALVCVGAVWVAAAGTIGYAIFAAGAASLGRMDWEF